MRSGIEPRKGRVGKKIEEGKEGRSAASAWRQTGSFDEGRPHLIPEEKKKMFGSGDSYTFIDYFATELLGNRLRISNGGGGLSGAWRGAGEGQRRIR